MSNQSPSHPQDALAGIHWQCATITTAGQTATVTFSHDGGLGCLGLTLIAVMPVDEANSHFRRGATYPDPELRAVLGRVSQLAVAGAAR